MELDEVDAMAVAVVALEDRLVLVGEEAGRQQGTAGQRTVGDETLLGPVSAVATYPLLQWQVDAVQIGAVERRHLVEALRAFRRIAQGSSAYSRICCQSTRF